MGWRSQHNREIDQEAEERARFAALSRRTRLAVRLEQATYALLLAAVLALIAWKVLAQPASAQPYDDHALLRQLGFVSGQAVVCKLDTPELAAEVAKRIADVMGYGEEETRAILFEESRASQVGGCRPLDPEKFEATWTAMKRRAGVEP